jgi:hypothetical protein
MARDLIICCFSKPGGGQLRNAGLGSALTPDDVFPVSKLSNPVDVIAIEKSMAGHVASSSGQYCDAGDVWGGFCFDRIAERMKAAGGGSIIRGALIQQGKNPADYEGGRIALIAFSAGHTMARHILSTDADKIDTLISLDGIAFSKVNGEILDDPNWMGFAKRACGIDRMGANRNPYLGPMMVIGHTRIAAPSAAVSATYESSRRMFWRLSDAYFKAQASVPKSFVDEMANAQSQILGRMKQSLDSLPYPLKINCTVSKTFTRDTANPNTTGYLGNLWDFEWNGTQGPDHCFCAYVVQKVLLESFLIPRWNSKNVAIAGVGIGSDEALTNGSVTFQSPSSSQKGGGVVTAGALGPAFYSAKTVAIGALMAYGGYRLGKKLFDKDSK